MMSKSSYGIIEVDESEGQIGGFEEFHLSPFMLLCEIVNMVFQRNLFIIAITYCNELNQY